MRQCPPGVRHLLEEYVYLQESNKQASSNLAQHGGTKILPVHQISIKEDISVINKK